MIPEVTPTLDDEPKAALAPANKPSKRRPVLVATALVVVLGLGGAGAYMMSHKPAAKPVALTKVTMYLNWLNSTEFAGFDMAVEKGYYKEAGLDVTLKEYDEKDTLNDEVGTDELKFANSTPMEVLSARDEGSPVKAVAAIYQVDPWALAVTKASGIKTPADLKGKRLGSASGALSTAVYYQAFLAYANLKPEQVTMKTAGFDAVKSLSGDVDAVDIFRTDQTFLLDEAKVDYSLILPEQYGFSVYGNTVETNENLIKNNPDVVRKFVQATLKGWSYTLDHQSETLQAITKYQNKDYSTPGHEQHILTASAPLIRPTGGQVIGDMQFLPWNKAYEGMKAAGLVKTKLDVSAAYTTQFVK